MEVNRLREGERIEQMGEYTIRYKCNGMRTVYGPRIWEYGLSVPSEDAIKARVQNDLKELGRLSLTTRTYLKRQGLLNEANPRFSVNSGFQSLGLENPESNENYFKKAEAAFYSTWSKSRVKRFVRDHRTKISSIAEFKKKHHEEYCWIIWQERTKKGKKYQRADGLRIFMEHRYPGLYPLLAHRTSDSSIDYERLGEVLARAASAGIPLTAHYLETDENHHRRSWYRQVKFILNKHTLRGNYSTFNEVVSRLSGISKHEIEARARGRKECATLAEKLVELYLTWASRLSFDPIKLDLPPLQNINFDRDLKEFTFGNGKNGFADGRVGNRPVEVKTGTTPFRDETLRDFLSRYKLDSKWSDGAQFGEPIAIFFQRPKFYLPGLPQILKNGVRFIDHSTFKAALEELTRFMTRGQRTLLENLRPRIHLESILEMCETLSPERGLAVLSSGGLATERTWYLNMLDTLIHTGRGNGSS